MKIEKMNKQTMKMAYGNLARLTIEDTVGEKKVVSSSMLKLSVLFTEKLDFAGNQSVEKDTPKLVGIVENVIEENPVDIYIMNYLVTNVKNLQPSDIIVNFATNISVKDVHLMKHILTKFIQTMKILSVQISTNEEVWSTKGLRRARCWGVMVLGASLGI